MNLATLRTRWAAMGAALAVTLGGGGLGIAHATTSSGERPIYQPINPCRLADIRPAPFTVGGRTSPLGPDDVYTLSGWGAVGNCNLPAGSVGLALNVTAVDPTQATYLTVFPDGAPLPLTSNLNPTPGQPPTPNAVNVDLSTAGKFGIFNKFGNVYVVVDVVGYYDDHNHDDRYYTKAKVDSLIADITSSPVVLGEGIGWVSNTSSPSTVSIGEQGAYIDGGAGGTAQLSLTGPVELAGSSYALASVKYCMDSVGGFVDEASIIGIQNSIVGDPLEFEAETKDTTDRSTAGCYTIVPSPEVAAYRSHHLMLYVQGEVAMGEVTTTWTPIP